MAFFIAKVNTKGVLLNRNDKSFSGPLFLVVGIVLTFIGLVQLYFYSSLDGALRVLSPFISILGIAGIVNGIRHPSIQRRSIPDSLYFDNEKGRLEISHRFSENQNAFIFYDELKEFSLEIINEPRVTRYVVLMKKIDGGQWDLFHSTSYASATRFIEILKSRVMLSAKPVKDVSSGIALSKIFIDQRQGSLHIHWKKNIRGSISSLALISSILLLAFALIVYQNIQTGDPVYFWAQLITALLMILFVPTNLYNVVKDYQTIHSIEVDKGSIHVIEKNSRGKVSNEKAFNFPKLFSIYYQFNSANPDARLYFVDEAIRGGTAARANNTPSALNDFSVSLPDLTSVEVLGIESCIQDFVRSNTTAKVL